MTTENENPPFGDDPINDPIENLGENPGENPESPDMADDEAGIEPGESPFEGLQQAESESDVSDYADDSEGSEEESPESKLTAEVADLKDKLLRALAETENVRRRAQREQEDANKYAVTAFAREIVEVRDNLRRALDAVDDDLRQNNGAIAGLLEGIEMTERTILAAFERFGIKSIEALHQKFDHNLHEALFEVEDSSVPNGTIVQELQAGYKIHDRLLRPAKVGVSKGGAKVAADSGESRGTTGEATGEATGDQSVKKSAQAYEKSDPGAGAKVDKEL